MSKVKDITSSVIRYLKKAWTWVPRLLLVVLKMPSGRRIIIGLIVAALAALGVNAPFELVQSAVNEVATWIGMDGVKVSFEQVVALIISLVFAEGTLRANDTVADWKATALPGRMYIHDIKARYGDRLLPSMQAAVVDGEVRMIDYYEVDRHGVMFVGTTDGKRAPLRKASQITDLLRAELMERLQKHS